MDSESAVTELITKTIIFSVVALFIIISLLWTKPVSGYGKSSFKLCLVNAFGWLLLLPLSDTGHPPPSLYPTLLFWLINLALLPAIALALWRSHKDREEKGAYLAIASVYLVMNIVILFIWPLVWIVLEASR
jgi:hypothetical protein